MFPELLYRMALTQVPQIGDVQARVLLQHFGSATAVFAAPARDLERIEGIGTVRAKAIRQFDRFRQLEPELRFLEKHQLHSWFLIDNNYPRRLQHCYDPPVLLFGKGEMDLDAPRLVAIVGTRSPTEYGRQWTEQLVRDLAPYKVTIVSGLAIGIDACAHRAALKAGLPTIGVVGHGLARIYPSEHSALAREMIARGGGLLTEFLSHEKPDKHHFPLRNRIVAGLCDLTVVVETAPKGGSMITAKLADSYHRDVFALPGRVTDKSSTGCNLLIQTQKAQLVTGAADIAAALGWNDTPKPAARQTRLFPELSEEERKLADLLRTNALLHVDELSLQSGLTGSAVANALLQMELQGLVQSLPGKRYRLT